MGAVWGLFKWVAVSVVKWALVHPWAAVVVVGTLAVTSAAARKKLPYWGGKMVGAACGLLGGALTGALIASFGVGTGILAHGVAWMLYPIGGMVYGTIELLALGVVR